MKYRALPTVYFINITLLICHEIDSACWSEWELFHLPGGATFFVALHLLLVPSMIYGLVLLLNNSRHAIAVSLIVGLGGLAGFAAHTIFLLSGDERFSTVFSIALIAAFGLFSAIQLALIMRKLFS